MRKTGPDHKTAELVKSRANGLCLRCQRRPGVQIHHRTPRGAGGTRNPKINSPENLVWLCLEDHSWAERNRADALRDGWLVSRYADPLEKYLITLHHQMIMLTADGGMVVNDLGDPDDEVPF